MKHKNLLPPISIKPIAQKLAFRIASSLAFALIFQLYFLSPSLQLSAQDSFKEDFQRVQTVLRGVPKRTLPSVVQLNISALKDSPASPNFLFDFFNDKEQKQDDSSPHKYRSAVLGSGVIFRREGKLFYLITNNHVVEDADNIQIISHKEHKFEGKIVGRDERVDLAVISFEAEDSADLQVATLGDSNTLEIGDWVMAIGSPNGFRSSVTMGIVSYVGRHGGPGQNINDFIQTDAAINHGNSGGPLINMHGEVIGINTWIASQSGSNAGLGFAIPINNTKYIVESFLKEGKVRYGWLGIVMEDYSTILNRISPKVEHSILNEYGVYGKKGVFITSIYKDSPADRAGLRPGDFITAVNGKEVASTNVLTYSVGIIPPGKQVELQLIRSTQAKTTTQKTTVSLSVTLGERKERELLNAKSQQIWPGIDTIPLNPEVVKALKQLNTKLKVNSIENLSGMWVLRVIPQSKADLLGLQQGDVITKIDGQEIHNLSDFYSAINRTRTQDNISYTYWRNEQEFQTEKAASTEN